VEGVRKVAVRGTGDRPCNPRTASCREVIRHRLVQAFFALNPAQLVACGRPEQIELLAAQEERLADRPTISRCTSATSGIKINYWHAVEAGDDARANLLSGEHAP
jgi:hypothetical protein